MFLRVLQMMVLMLAISLAQQAEAGGGRAAWKKLDRALAYLKALPEVAWVKYEGRDVLIGWKGFPGNFGPINKTAAQKAARALRHEVTVYSLRAEQTTFKPGGEQPHLCQTIANPTEIVHSNCR